METVQSISWWLFWLSVATIAYTYFGFPLVLALRGLLRRPDVWREGELPSLTILIVGYNEAEVIASKLDNALACDYPRDKLHVVVASDGSADGMNEIVAAYPDPLVKLVALPRQGKNATLNAAMEEAEGEIVVFSDAETMLEPQSIRRLVKPFADPEVGGVGGDFRYVDPAKKGAGERSYWSVDRLVKRLQSRGGSMTSATGQIYALRRGLFTPVPGGVTDDFYNSTNAIAAKKRLVFEPQAVSSGPVADSVGEFRRKVRVSTRGLNSVWHRRRLLNPLRYGFYAFQLFSHKVLRRLIAFPLLILLVTAPILWSAGWLYQLATVGQLLLHLAALVAVPLRRTRIGRFKVLALPYFFDMVNISTVIALGKLLRGQSFDVWNPER